MLSVGLLPWRGIARRFALALLPPGCTTGRSDLHRVLYIYSGGKEIPRDEDLPPELALWVIDATLATLPADARSGAQAEVLGIFADAYDASREPYPEWLRVGLGRTGTRLQHRAPPRIPPPDG